MTFSFETAATQGAVIKVIGVGGGGGNAVEYMSQANIDGVEFMAANTDAQALKNSSVKSILQLGAGVTKGLGAGANPEIGKHAAEEDLDKIMESCGSADIVFLTAGMGGGTGSGALPVIARALKDEDILPTIVFCALLTDGECFADGTNIFRAVSGRCRKYVLFGCTGKILLHTDGFFRL